MSVFTPDSLQALCAKYDLVIMEKPYYNTVTIKRHPLAEAVSFTDEEKNIIKTIMELSYPTRYIEYKF